MSVLDFLHLGSSLSVRSFGRLGASMSVLDFLHLGSSLSVRSFARLGSVASVHNQLALGADDLVTPEVAMTKDTDFKVAGARVLSLTSTGGSLHGTWSSENMVSMSDRRVKRDIAELAATLPASSADPGARSLSWTLNALRPVSFRMKRGPEAKHTQFGFLAQDLELVVPEAVRVDPATGLYSVSMNSLVAVLVHAARE